MNYPLLGKIWASLGSEMVLSSGEMLRQACVSVGAALVPGACTIWPPQRCRKPPPEGGWWTWQRHLAGCSGDSLAGLVVVMRSKKCDSLALVVTIVSSETCSLIFCDTLHLILNHVQEITLFV